MSRKPRSFEVLVKLAERARNTRASQLRSARSNLEEQRLQLLSLAQISSEYTDSEGTLAGSQADARARFRLRLSNLIGEQNQQLKALEAEAAQALERYHAAHRQKLSFERLDERSALQEAERQRAHERRLMAAGSSSMLKAEE